MTVVVHSLLRPLGKAAAGSSYHWDWLSSLLPPLKALDAGQVGLALSYAITLTGMFQWSVRQSAEVENMVMFICAFSAF